MTIQVAFARFSSSALNCVDQGKPTRDLFPAFKAASVFNLFLYAMNTDLKLVVGHYSFVLTLFVWFFIK